MTVNLSDACDDINHNNRSHMKEIILSDKHSLRDRTIAFLELLCIALRTVCFFSAKITSLLNDDGATLMSTYLCIVCRAIPIQPEVMSFSIVYPKLCIAKWSILGMMYLIKDTNHISELLLNSLHKGSRYVIYTKRSCRIQKEWSHGIVSRKGNRRALLPLDRSRQIPKTNMHRTISS